MGAFLEAGSYIVETIFTLYLIVVILRFLLQLARADFYNPISQFIVKATNPPLKPLRRIIPGIGGLDVASIVLALIVQLIAIFLLGFINQLGLVNPLYALLWGSLGLLSLLCKFYFVTLIVSIIASFIAPGSHHPVLMLVSQLNDPIMRPLRKILPPMGGLDFSPILAFMLINVAEIFIRAGVMKLGPFSQLALGL